MILFIAASFAIGCLPSASASLAPSPCSLSVVLTPSQLVAEITATEPGAVTFQGNVTIDKPATVRAVVSLQASTSTDWAFSVSPATMTFAGAATTQSFTVTVVVPAGTPATTIGQLTVTATANAAGLSCVPAQASSVIVPAPYFGNLRARFDTADVQAVGAPLVATFRLTLTMDTNVDDQVSVSLNVEVPDGTTHDAPSVVLIVPSSNGTASGSATFHVRAGTLAPGQYPVIARAGSSAQGNDSTMANGTLTISLLPTTPGLAPALALAAIGAAAVVARWRKARS